MTEPSASLPPAGMGHVAIVVAGLGAGGAERVISLLVRGWIEEGRRVTVIAFDGPDAAVFHPLDPRVGIMRLGIGSGGGGRLAGALAILRRCRALRRALDRLEPDVTVSFLTKINVLTLLASLGRGRRVIVSERNNPRMQRASRVWNLAFAWLARNAAAIVMQTHASLECLTPATQRRAVVIPNPIMVGSVRREAEASLVLAAAGRLTWQKGFDRLIEAFALVADHHPGWTLRIWGEGEAREALEAQIAALGLGHRALLPGNSHSPDEWVGEADAFVLSSRFEGFCNALGEAMAAGLPSFRSTAIMGPRRSFGMTRTGCSSAMAMSTGWRRRSIGLLGDADLRDRLGEAAKMAMVRFRPPVILERWNELLAMVSADRDQGRAFSALLSESRNLSRLVQPSPSLSPHASNLSGLSPCATSQSSDMPSPSRSG